MDAKGRPLHAGDLVELALATEETALGVYRGFEDDGYDYVSGEQTGQVVVEVEGLPARYPTFWYDVHVCVDLRSAR